MSEHPQPMVSSGVASRGQGFDSCAMRKVYSMQDVSRLTAFARRHLPTMADAHLHKRVTRMGPAGLEWLAGQFETGPLDVFVPSEQVLVLTVDLPAPRRRDQLAALPWAIEDHVTQSPTKLHLVLGPEIAPRRFLVAVVDIVCMANWSASLIQSGLKQCRIVPDAFILPIPAVGAWSIAQEGNRFLVRDHDGSAFAIAFALFIPAWNAANAPQLQLYGSITFNEFLPVAPYRASDRNVADLWATSTADKAIDLSQGAFAPQRDAIILVARRVAALAGIAAVLYVGIMGADTVALNDLADSRSTEAARLYAQIVPPDKSSGDMAADIQALNAAAQTPPNGFLPVMGRASKALLPMSAEISFDSLTYSSDDASVNFAIEVRNFAALEHVEEALKKGGMKVDAGAANAASGGVEAKLTVSNSDTP